MLPRVALVDPSTGNGVGERSNTFMIFAARFELTGRPRSTVDN
jgi:hypothetical protein